MARLGTVKRPAVVRVQTEARAKEILALCDAHDLYVVIGLEPDQPEDISDVERALFPPEPARNPLHVGRNDPCPCGSGKKFKKCCQGHGPLTGP